MITKEKIDKTVEEQKCGCPGCAPHLWRLDNESPYHYINSRCFKVELRRQLELISEREDK